MKKLLFATVAALGATALFAEEAATTFNNSIGFEAPMPIGVLDDKKDDAGAESTGPRYFYYQSNNSSDASEVVAYEGSPTWPASSVGTPGSQFLNLSTEGGILWRNFNNWNASSDTPTFGAPMTIASEIYIDTMVQFTATDSSGDPSDEDLGSDGKLAIWLKDNGDGTTNLCVRSSLVSFSTGFTTTPTTFALESPIAINSGAWYRLTVKAIPDVTKQLEKNSDVYGSMGGFVGFQIYLNGEVLGSNVSSFDQSLVNLATGASVFGAQFAWLDLETDAEFISFLTSGKVFVDKRGILAASSLNLTAVGFKGTGAVDNLTFTDVNPFEEVVTTLDFTLAVDEGAVSTIKYILGSGTETDLPTGGKITGLEAGNTLKFKPYLVGATKFYSKLFMLGNTEVKADAEGYYNVTVAAGNLSATYTEEEIETSTETGEAVIPEGTTAADVGITGGAFAAGENKPMAASWQKAVTWATKNSVSPSTVNGMSFDGGVANNDNEAAYLLDCAPSAVETEKGKFQITSIVWDNTTSAWKIQVAGEDATRGDGYGNGIIDVKTSSKVDFSDTATSGNLLFYKASLVPYLPANN